jgi:GAF domain-containing protein
MPAKSFLKPTEAFAEIGRMPFGEISLGDSLARIAELARQTIPDAAEVSVTLSGPGGAHTAAFTGRPALILDEWQYRHGYGPCLAAALAAITVEIPDTAGEGRWPRWGDRAVQAGVHSSMSIGVPLHRSVAGALNVYSGTPNGFDEKALDLAHIFAGYVAVAIANGIPVTVAAEPVAALDNRAIIEQAKGVVMAERGCGAEEALAVLASMSRVARRPVRDIAAEVVAGVATG